MRVLQPARHVLGVGARQGRAKAHTRGRSFDPHAHGVKPVVFCEAHEPGSFTGSFTDSFTGDGWRGEKGHLPCGLREGEVLQTVELVRAL